jgi:5-methylthioadenosine/S-adenosylhomocysteine deaminase
MPPPESIDFLIAARWVLPMAPANTVLTDHAVAVTGGRIVAVGPAREITSRFEAREHVVRAEHALLPGFVNAHTRAASVLLRGVPRAPLQDGRPSASDDRRFASPDFVRDGTKVAIAEMLLAGITCFADTNLFPEESARVAASARIRAAIGLPLADVPSVWAGNATEHLAKAEQIWDTYRSDPWVDLYFALPSALEIGDATLSRLRRVADELDARVAMPVHESELSVREAVSRDGKRPLERLQSLGLLRPGFCAAHLNQLDGPDLDIVTSTGIAAIACPQAGLRQGHGSAPLSQLESKGVTVGLGTGDPVFSGALDLLAEARAAALFGNAGSMRDLFGDPRVGDAEGALRMATLGGAVALGMGSRIGSIEPGKAADLVSIDLSPLACQPPLRPAEAVLYGATRGQVADVWISGRAAVAGGRLLALDEQEIAALARQWGERVRLEV